MAIWVHRSQDYWLCISIIYVCIYIYIYMGLYILNMYIHILKEINPGISLEGMMLKLKLQYFGHLMWRVDSLEKTDAERDWGQEKKGTTEDEMAGWHHWLDGHKSEWTLGVGDGQGGLACCDSWGRKELDTTEQLNWTELRRDSRKVLWCVVYINYHKKPKK